MRTSALGGMRPERSHVTKSYSKLSKPRWRRRFSFFDFSVSLLRQPSLSVVERLTALGWGEELEPMKPYYNLISDHNLVRAVKKINDKGKALCSLSIPTPMTTVVE